MSSEPARSRWPARFRPGGAMSIRKARPEETDTLADALVSAFLEDPVVHWLFPEEEERAARLRVLYDELLLRRLTLPHGQVYTTEEISGGCLWAPPGAWRMGPLQMVRQLRIGWKVWGRDLARALG